MGKCELCKKETENVVGDGNEGLCSDCGELCMGRCKSCQRLMFVEDLSHEDDLCAYCFDTRDLYEPDLKEKDPYQLLKELNEGLKIVIDNIKPKSTTIH